MSSEPTTPSNDVTSEAVSTDKTGSPRVLPVKQKQKGIAVRRMVRCFRKNDLYPLLHYDEETDTAFCHVCMRAENNRIPESTFTSTGVRDWKKPLEKFKKHDQSESHKTAVQRQLTLPSSSYRNADTMLPNVVASEQKSTEQYL